MSKRKTCECGAQVSSNAATCPKCGKDLLKSDEMFCCRNCGTRLLKDDYWNERVTSGRPTGFISTGGGGSFTYSGPRRLLVQFPCPECGEKYPFMGPFEKFTRVSVQLTFLFLIGVPFILFALLYGIYKGSWLWIISAPIAFWLTIKFCRKVVKR